MNKIILNGEQRATLNDLDQQTEICDGLGNVVGVYLPIRAYQLLESFRKHVYATIKVPFTEEELQRMRQEKGGRSLKEFWRSLGQEA